MYLTRGAGDIQKPGVDGHLTMSGSFLSRSILPTRLHFVRLHLHRNNSIVDEIRCCRDIPRIGKDFYDPSMRNGRIRVQLTLRYLRAASTTTSDAGTVSESLTRDLLISVP